MNRVLVTGANGFVGKSLSSLLKKQGFQVRAALREQSRATLPKDFPVRDQVTFDLDSNENNYDLLLDDVDFVVHLAARVHIHKERGDDRDVYRKTNIDGSRLLAQQAAQHGVRRFIFLSTAKVNGEYTITGKLPGQGSFTESDPAKPQDAYSTSKFEAERAIHDICQSTQMESVILRPSLIYGPGVKANFLRLLETIARGYPLPLASIKNMRSIIFVENLCNAILTCMMHPSAANQTFLISDCDISVPELIRKIAFTMERKSLLMPLPLSLLSTLAALTGKTGTVGRLTQSLVIDNSKIKIMLAWSPPYTLNEGLTATVNWFRGQ
jgi:nucleoside-diphosphate-sugar epimerase